MTSSDPSAIEPDPRRRPAIVDAAAWCYVAVGVANLVVGARILVFVPAVVADYVRSGRPVPTQAITAATVIIAVATLVFSSVLVVFALRLRAGSRWARPILLTFSLLSLASLLVGGGPALIVILLCVVAAVVVTRPPVSAWLRAQRGGPEVEIRY